MDSSRREKIAASAALLLVLLAAVPVAAAVSGDDRVVVTPAISSALPHRTVNALLKGKGRYIYLGTEAGLVRTDGAGIEPVPLSGPETPGSARIMSLHLDRSGTVWAGTAGAGLFRVIGGRLESYPASNSFLDNHIRAITSDSDGAVWAGTEYGLYRIGEGSAERFGLDEGMADNLVTALAADGAGNLWAGTMEGGLARFRGDSLIDSFGPREGLACPRLLSLAADSAGNIWIGTMDGLFILNTDSEGIRALPVSSPVTSLDNYGWGVIAGTMTAGLYIISPAGGNSFSYINILDGSSIRSAISPARNVIWAGTGKRGLVWIVQPGARVMEIPGGSVNTVLAADGAIIAGTAGYGIFRIEGGRAEEVAGAAEGISMVRALHLDRKGRLWAGTRDNGLHLIDGDRIDRIDRVLSDDITAIAFHHDRFWAGTGRGLASFRDIEEEITVVLKDIRINTLYPDGRNSLLAGTSRGIWKVDSAGSASLLAAVEEGSDILSLFRGSGGELWIGTNGGGLKRLGGADYTTEDGLPGDFIYSICAPDPGYLWAGCENGVFRVSIDSLNAYAGGRTRILAPLVYGRMEGLPPSGCIGSCNPACAVSQRGGLIYPAGDGVAVINRSIEKRPLPEVVIERVGQEEKLQREEGRILFPNPPGPVRIEFTAFDYAAPGRLSFLYRLDPIEAEYRPVLPGSERAAVYSNLPRGDYTFRVIAISGGGIWSEKPATAHFSIAPPFYLRGRVIVSASILFLAIISAVYAAVAARRARSERKKYSTTRIGQDRREETLEELHTLMEDEKLFLDPGLTLSRLASRLRIHSNYLSRIINEEIGVNYNDFVNRYRVEESCRQLREPGSKDRNITEIMYSSGFYSKSTFNTAFKKITGTTPSKYRRENR